MKSDYLVWVLYRELSIMDIEIEIGIFLRSRRRDGFVTSWAVSPEPVLRTTDLITSKLMR